MTEETLFQEALSLPADERAAFLERACQGRPDLRAAVEALLAVHETSDQTLDRPPGDAATVELSSERAPAGHQATETGEHIPDTDPPRQAGATTAEFRTKLEAGVIISDRYTLQEPIGEGGMGEVWVARQNEPVKRKVALKLIKPGMDSRSVLARFEQERQALAMMDHPNIARVLDAGLTQTGQPFFVMELVDGLPLTRFCDELKLTPRERLELFVPICQAVQHAHHKGIIHRDLKPANILVTMIDGKPVPRVIDFGVAKATAGKLTDESMSTQFGAIVGTLEYMSPEQAGSSGIDIDTRADIYSLGVILYELLTGLRPIDAKRLKKAALTEMIRIIREEEPKKPSTRLSTDESLPSLAAIRQVEPRKLMALLRGELDWVVMKCLEKNRDRRYETANALALDIRRYLANEAVEARPPSARYRLGKFLVRNKGPAIASSLLLLALLGGIAGTTFGLILANRARDAEARRADGERRAKLEAAAERDKAIEAERKTRIERDKAVAAEARTKLINDFLTRDLLTQAEPANNDVEDKVTLLEVLDRAAEKVGRRFAGNPEMESALRNTIAITYHGLASWEKAEAQWRAILETARKRDPQSSESSIAQAELSHILRHRGQLDAEVVTMAETAVEGLRRTLGPDDEATLKSLTRLANAYLDVGRIPEAIALFEKARDGEIARLGPDHIDTLSTLNDLALAYKAAGRLAEATALLERVRDAEMATLAPDDPMLLTTLSNLAAAYEDARRLPEAIALYERVRDIEATKLGPDHPGTLVTLNNLATSYQAAGRLPDAIALLEKVRDATMARSGLNHPLTLATLANLAMAYQAAGKLPESIELLEKVREAQVATLGADHPDTLVLLYNLAGSYQAVGKLPEAIALFDQIQEPMSAKLGPDHPYTLAALNNLAVACWSAKQFDRSVPLFERLLKKYEAKLGRQDQETRKTAANLGVNYKDAGRLDAAIPLLEEAHRTLGQLPDYRWVGAQLGDAYAKAGRPVEAARLTQEYAIANARATLPKESPQLADALAQSGLALLQAGAHADAEPLLRECLAIREKTQPDAWNTFNARTLLGGALLGQKKYTDAEPLLVAGYEGMKNRETTIPPEGKDCLTAALQRLVQISEATDRPDEAARWRKELEAVKPAEKKP